MQIIPESPAERAMLQSGDVIVAIGDKEVDSMEELQREITRKGDYCSTGGL